MPHRFFAPGVGSYDAESALRLALDCGIYVSRQNAEPLTHTIGYVSGVLILCGAQMALLLSFRGCYMSIVLIVASPLS